MSTVKKGDSKMSANVKIVKLPSGNYNAKVYDYTSSSGKRHYKSLTAESKRDVKQMIAEFSARKNDKKARTPNITVGAAIESYIEIKANILSPSTIAGYDKIRRNNLQNLMNIKLSSLTSEEVQREINRESAIHSPKTVRNMFALLSSALTLYSPDKKITVTLPKNTKTDIKIPTENEMSALLEAIKNTDMEIHVYLAAFCGMRASEISALKWSDINLDSGYIAITKAVVKDVTGKYVEKGTKSIAGTRTIKIFKPVLAVLQASPNKNGAVTTITPQGLYKKYSSILEKNNIRHYRFHDLRHYTVSAMLALNIPKKYIADYVGHESEIMIDRVYGHIMKNAQDIFLQKADDYFSNL